MSRTMSRRRSNTALAQSQASFPSAILAADLIPEYIDECDNKRKWKILEDVVWFEFKISDLKLASFLRKGESHVGGQTMRRRAVVMKTNLGLIDAKFVLDHQAEIPVEFRNNYLIFPGTLLRRQDGGGRMYVASLCWRDIRWHLTWNWLGRDWGVYDRFVLCSV